jgi:hypothetical protein
MHFRPRTQPILAHELGKDMNDISFYRVHQKMSVASLRVRDGQLNEKHFLKRFQLVIFIYQENNNERLSK